MEHTNEKIKSILRQEYSDYMGENQWHYDRQYRMLEKMLPTPAHPEHFQDDQLVIDVADLRNKLQPITSAIQYIEIGDINKLVEFLPQLKLNVNYMAARAVFPINK